MVFSLFTVLLVLLCLVVLPVRKDRYVPTHYDPTFLMQTLQLALVPLAFEPFLNVYRDLAI
jgi:hypothetical protein